MGFWKGLFRNKDNNQEKRVKEKEEFKLQEELEKEQNLEEAKKKEILKKQEAENREEEKTQKLENKETENKKIEKKSNNTVFRDRIISDDSFFDKQIEVINARIKERKFSYDRVFENNTEADVSNFFIAFNVYYVNLCNLEYSKGENISKIINNAKEAMNSAVNFWNKNEDYSERGNIMYNYFIQSICLGILLDLDKSYFENLAEKVQKYKYDDFIIQYLLYNKVPSFKITDKLIFENKATLTFKEIIVTKNKENSQEKLKQYLDNIYYSEENLEEYYNIHETNKSNYYGYWSWESAAIVKLKNLDDTNFRDNVYYPSEI